MSTEPKLSLADKVKAAAAEGAAKAAAELKAPAKVQGYQANHVKRLILKNGTVVLPNEDGVYIPKTQEEYDFLEHLAASSTSSLEKILASEKE